MNVTFLAEASREFLAASEYYDRQQPGLGQRFEEEIDWAIRWVIEHPNALPLRHGVYRRLNLHVFPYYIPTLFADRQFGLSGSLTRSGGQSTGSAEPNAESK